MNFQAHTNELLFRFLPFFLIFLILVPLFTGCATLPRNPVPKEKISKAEVVDLPGIRSWADEFSTEMQKDIINSVIQEIDYESKNPDQPIHTSALALSGGGSYGAFGAGFLNGWTRAGTRPTFKLVTGISTGALIAPFAFLGSEYDDVLRNFYTGVSTEDIAKPWGISALWKDSFTDSSPLVEIIANSVDHNFLKKIAEAHNEGSRLYIGTTNLDAQRLMIWNMGAIASSGHPDALELFRKVILASASMPALFPPVFFDVEVDDKKYDEMHVDGGVITQVFFYGAIVDISEARKELLEKNIKRDKGKIYVIRNDKISPVPEEVKRNIPRITGRTLSTMIKVSATNDLFRIYLSATRDGIEFNYVGIPDDYEFTGEEAFDRLEMIDLFNLGYSMAISGYEWQHSLPIFEEFLRK